MNKQKYFDYLRSQAWKDKRQELFLSRGKKCENCNSEAHLEVHHLTYANIFNEPLSDLKILCKICHSKEHGGKLFKKQHRKTKRKKIRTHEQKMADKKKRKLAIRKKWGY